MDALPAVDEVSIALADVLKGRAGDAVRSILFDPGEPLFLKSSDHGVIEPAHCGDHKDIVSGGVSAEIAVTLKNDDVFGTCSCCSDCCAVACGAAADDEDVAAVIDLDLLLRFQIKLIHIDLRSMKWISKTITHK